MSDAEAWPEKMTMGVRASDANLFAQGWPFDAPQPDVEDVEAEPLALHQPEGGVHVRRDDGVEVRQAQLGLEHVTDVLVVFDAKDAMVLYGWRLSKPARRGGGPL